MEEYKIRNKTDIRYEYFKDLSFGINPNNGLLKKETATNRKNVTVHAAIRLCNE